MRVACHGSQLLPFEDLPSPWAERQLRPSFLSACDYDARASEVRTHVQQLGQKLFACHGRLDHMHVSETSQSTRLAIDRRSCRLSGVLSVQGVDQPGTIFPMLRASSKPPGWFYAPGGSPEDLIERWPSGVNPGVRWLC